MLRDVDVGRVGRAIRALRVHRGWRQLDLAAAAGVSRTEVGRIERGERAGLRLDAVDAVAIALGASADIAIRWHGENLDRLLDEAHARLVDVVVERLRSLGWEVAVEVSFSRNGERGSIDVLAFNPRSRALVVIEVKSVTPDMQAMLAGIDRKARLGPVIARDRGWNAAVVARILVIWTRARTDVGSRPTRRASAPPCLRARARCWGGSPNRRSAPFAASGSGQMSAGRAQQVSAVSASGFVAHSRARITALLRHAPSWRTVVPSAVTRGRSQGACQSRAADRGLRSAGRAGDTNPADKVRPVSM
jgi:transcriptional regulator with XRE-family HTH domain